MLSISSLPAIILWHYNSIDFKTRRKIRKEKQVFLFFIAWHHYRHQYKRYLPLWYIGKIRCFSVIDWSKFPVIFEWTRWWFLLRWTRLKDFTTRLLQMRYHKYNHKLLKLKAMANLRGKLTFVFFDRNRL